MKYITRFLKSVIIEVLIIFIYVLLINNYIGNVEKTIKADGLCYYDYLPSLFIHHDLIRKDISVGKDPGFYKRIITLGVYATYHDTLRINKVPCGTAILQMPFFGWAYYTTTRDGTKDDGYQRPFQLSVFYAAIFYLFLSAFFLKKVLQQFHIRKYVIILCQLLLVLSTGVTHYANYDAAYSHVYSLFLVTAFFYFARSYFNNRNLNHFILACILLALVIITRQINIIILLFIPFLAGSVKNLKEGFIYLLHNLKKALTGVLLILSIFFIQCVFWYLQTGNFFVYSYPGETFNFLHPHIIDILFSYRKGLFVYAPVLVISLMGLIWLLYKRRYYLFFSWIGFFFILTYMYSSWWTWFYGCSYGMRVYIDYYAIFFILFAILINEVKPSMKIPVIIISLLTIPVNIIQTFQYKEYILSWDNMDGSKYWKVFLRTADRYRGLVWKRTYTYNYFTTAREIFIGNIHTSPNSDTVICTVNSSAIPEFAKVCMIQVDMDDKYERSNNSKIRVKISNVYTQNIYYNYSVWFIQFADKQFGEWQTGLYNYEITPIKDAGEKVVTLSVKTGKQSNNFKDVRLKFFRPA